MAEILPWSEVFKALCMSHSQSGFAGVPGDRGALGDALVLVWEAYSGRLQLLLDLKLRSQKRQN